jgi:hypothetical protein
MTQELVRRERNNALVNTDALEYAQAKARMKTETYIRSLEKRINRLEIAIEEMSETIANCKRD